MDVFALKIGNQDGKQTSRTANHGNRAQNPVCKLEAEAIRRRVNQFARCGQRGGISRRNEPLCLMFSIAVTSTITFVYLLAVLAAQSWAFHVVSCNYL